MGRRDSIIATVLSTAQGGNLQENYIVNDDAERDFFGVFWTGQTFTPATAHTLGAVKLKVARILIPGIITVSIRATSGGLPTGADLAVGTFDGDLLNAKPTYIERLVSMVVPVALSVSVKYAIVVRALTGDASNLISWREDVTAPTYAGGERVDSVNSGSTWTNVTGDDMWFAEYGS